MLTLWSFPPLASFRAHTLILGSMPGTVSLRAGAYYAHPRNRFWPLMARLHGFDPQLDYAGRLDALSAAGVALWDVLQSCQRPGSLDGNIIDRSMVVNDFTRFFADHPNIHRVFFNGGKAATIFRRHVSTCVPLPPLEFQQLPSTSPANAAFTLERLAETWRVVLATPPQRSST